jgi:hypothetical protein
VKALLVIDNAPSHLSEEKVRKWRYYNFVSATSQWTCSKIEKEITVRTFSICVGRSK